MSWPRLLQEAKACKFCLLFNINIGLVLLKLADTVLILINTGPSNVKELKFCMGVLLRADLTGHNHLTCFGRKGLDGRALLGQPSKQHTCRIFSHNVLLHF